MRQREMQFGGVKCDAVVEKCDGTTYCVSRAVQTFVVLCCEHRVDCLFEQNFPEKSALTSVSEVFTKEGL